MYIYVHFFRIAMVLGPSCMEFRTMPWYNEKNSQLDATIAQEIMKIFNIRVNWMKILLHDCTTMAQKVEKFSPICQNACLTRYFMVRRSRKTRIKYEMLAVAQNCHTFCAFETGI